MSAATMTAVDRAYSYAKERILDGTFAGGELLSEGDIAVSVKLSRTPVREAFLRLEAEGLLRLYPRRGALVIPVSPTEVNNVMEARLLVERFAVEKIGRATPELHARLQDAITEQERLAAAGDEVAFVAADHEFHRLLVAQTRNDILIAMHDSLRDRQRRMGMVAVAVDSGRMQAILVEHGALVAAIAAGDPAAPSILASHLQGTLGLLRG